MERQSSLTSTDYDATYEDSRRTHVQYDDNRTSLLRVRRRSASRGAPGHMSVAIEDSHQHHAMLVRSVAALTLITDIHKHHSDRSMCPASSAHEMYSQTAERTQHQHAIGTDTRL